MKHNVYGNTEGIRDALLRELDDLYNWELEEGEFLLFSDITNRPALKLLSDTVEMAAAQMSPPVEMKTRFWLRNRDEDTDSFIKRVLEESSVI